MESCWVCSLFVYSTVSTPANNPQVRSLHDSPPTTTKNINISWCHLFFTRKKHYWLLSFPVRLAYGPLWSYLSGPRLQVHIVVTHHARTIPVIQLATPKQAHQAQDSRLRTVWDIKNVAIDGQQISTIFVVAAIPFSINPLNKNTNNLVRILLHQALSNEHWAIVYWHRQWRAMACTLSWDTFIIFHIY